MQKAITADETSKSEISDDMSLVEEDEYIEGEFEEVVTEGDE